MPSPAGDSSYERDRLPGETVAQFNARRLRELEAMGEPGALEITIRKSIAAVPPIAWVAAGALAVLLVQRMRGDA